MKVTFAHICDYASVSREGKLSTMGIFDRIQVAAVPASHPLFYLAFELEMRLAELGVPFKMGIKLVDADGNKMLETEGEMQIDATIAGAEVVRIPQLVAFGGMPLPRLGRYRFDIFVNGDHKHAATFDVAVAVPGPGAAPTPGLPQ